MNKYILVLFGMLFQVPFSQAQTVRSNYIIVQLVPDTKMYEVIEVDREATEGGLYAREVRTIRICTTAEEVEVMMRQIDAVEDAKAITLLKQYDEVNLNRMSRQKARDDLSKEQSKE